MEWLRVTDIGGVNDVAVWPNLCGVAQFHGAMTGGSYGLMLNEALWVCGGVVVADTTKSCPCELIRGAIGAAAEGSYLGAETTAAL